MIVLIPGFATNTNIFYKLKEQLETWEIPYYELNYNAKAKTPQLAFMKEMDILLSGHDTSEIIPIAWSMGAILLLEFMEKIEIKFKKTILVSAGNNINNENYILEKLKIDLEKENSDTKVELNKFFASATYKKANIRKHNSKKEHLDSQININDYIIEDKEYLLNSLEHIKNLSFTNIPQGIFVLIHGLEDKIIPLTNAEKLKEFLISKDCLVNFYALSCGHTPFIEEFQSFKEILEHELF